MHGASCYVLTVAYAVGSNKFEPNSLPSKHRRRCGRMEYTPVLRTFRSTADALSPPIPHPNIPSPIVYPLPPLTVLS